MAIFSNLFSKTPFPQNTMPQIENVNLQPLSQAEYDCFVKIIYAHSRISLGPHKKDMVAARLIKRLKACNIPSFAEYIKFIESPRGASELTHFIDALSTNHTFFFREIAHFDFLKKTILPRLIGDPNRRTKHFRVWSAASSSGEEPYSIAILLSEFFNSYPQWSWSVEATDISTRILEMARMGSFERARLGTMENPLITKYFQKSMVDGVEMFQVSPLLKAKINFRQLNLLSASYPFLEKFDLIFCRNVMIYFDAPTKQELVLKLSNALLPGGYLYSGHAESLTGIKHNLQPIQVSVFQKPLAN